MWDNERLLLYWKPDPRDADFSGFDLSKMKLALVHDRFLPRFPGELFADKTTYFRYFHQPGTSEDAVTPTGFDWVYARPKREAGEIACFIDACYPNISPGEDVVVSWADHPTFDKNLWLWLVDQRSKRKAALGIAEYDSEVREGSLEWIQVLPEYQRRGLGRAVVLKLVELLKGSAEIITVSGEVKNPAQPDRLYRTCGFHGEDIWWVFRK